MARALVTRVTNVTPDAETLVVEYEVAFQGVDVPNGIDISMFSVSVGDADTLAQIRAKIVAGVQSAAAAPGYSVAANRIIMPSYTRG